MPEKYVKRTIFWENLTSLDSSHLEVFLGIFWEFFNFLNSNLNFKFGPVWYRPKPEPDRTGLTGGFVNPEHASHSGSEHAHGSASACLVQAVDYTTSSHNWFLKHGLSFSYLFTDNQLDSNSLSFYRDHLPANLPSSCCKHENTHHISTCLVVESRKTPIPSLACEQPLTSRGSTNQSCSRLVAIVRMNLTSSSGKDGVCTKCIQYVSNVQAKIRNFWLIYVRLVFFFTGSEIDMYKSTIAYEY